jgi:hypothetical protein
MGNHRRGAAGLQARLIGGREANLRPYRRQVNRPGQLDFLIAGTVDWSRANRGREMTDIRKQVLFAATSKAAFKPRSDIEGLGRKLRAIMRKVDAAELKPNDRQRLAEELLRLSAEAQWFADQVSKVK